MHSTSSDTSSLRDTKPARSARYKDGSSGRAASEIKDYRVLGSSGFSWIICKQSAPRSREITTSTPHHSFFTGRMLVLTANQQRQTTEGSVYHPENTHIHIPFNGPLSGTTQVSRHQKGKTDLDSTEARDSERQRHQLGICKSAPRSRQITMPTPHHSIFYTPSREQ